MTQAEVEGRRQAFVFESFFQKEVPGYQEAKIIGLSTQIGVRETRRVYGKHRLTKEECMSTGQAAGLAALQSLDQNCAARQLDVDQLRENLLRQGAILEIPDQAAFIGKDQWKLDFA